nr:hypothetical protein StreXyl84_54030 [Streptomyces sp. Xyl84]
MAGDGARDTGVTDRPEQDGLVGRLAEIMRLPGIFTKCRSSCSMGQEAESATGAASRTGRRKTAQAGQPMGSRFYGHRGERPAGGGE